MTVKTVKARKILPGVKYYRYWHTTEHGKPYTMSVDDWSVDAGKSHVGGDLPNWKKVISSGGSATNDYSMSGRNIEVGEQKPIQSHIVRQVTEYYREEWIMKRYQGTRHVPYNQVTPSYLQRTTEAANMKILGKINDSRNPFNEFAFFGELKKTITMIRNPAATLQKLAQQYVSNVSANKAEFAARHRKGRKALSLSRTVKQRQRALKRNKALLREERRLASNLWLQYRFGILPLIQDIEGAAQRFENVRYGNTSQFKWHKASHQEEFPGVNYLDEIIQDSGAYWRISYTSKVVAKTTLVAREKLELLDASPSIRGNIHAVISFKSWATTLIPALWDLTPMSVFMDYFVNVNAILSAALMDMRNIDHVERRYREEHILSATTTYLSNLYGSSTVLYANPGFTSVSTYVYKRDKWELTIPSISFTTPIGKPIRLANLAAFLNNVL